MSDETTTTCPRAEAAVIGSCFLRPDTASWLDLDRGDFACAKHRAVWVAIQELLDDGVAVDCETVGDRLARRKLLEVVGGYAALSELALATPTADNAEHYAAIVRAKAINRRVLELAGSLRGLLESGQAEGEELLDEAQALLGRVDRPRSSARSLADYVAEEQHAIATFDPRSDWAGVPTGIDALDQITGGLPIGSTTVLGARPSEGKSSVALAMAVGAARKTRRGVVILSAEDRASVMAQRAIANVADVSVSDVRSRSLGMLDRPRVLEASDEAHGRVFVEHVHGQRMTAVVRTIRSFVRLHDVQLVIYDYLQKCPRPNAARGASRDETTAESLNAFDDVVGELGVAGVMVSQLNRECEREQRAPEPRDLRDSGAIEAVARLILLLHPGVKDELQILVRKQTQGARETVARVRFDRARCRISDVRRETTREEDE